MYVFSCGGYYMCAVNVNEYKFRKYVICQFVFVINNDNENMCEWSIFWVFGCITLFMRCLNRNKRIMKISYTFGLTIVEVSSPFSKQGSIQRFLCYMR